MREERIEYLIHLVEKSDIQELEVWEGWGKRIRIVRRGVLSSRPAPTSVQSTPTPAAPPERPPEDVSEDHLVPVVSPMVGTFYRSSNPDAAPFVEVGSQVEPGQTLCIIEAMKLMNEIASEVGGSVRKVLVNNAEPVEFGQTLFLIEKPV